MNETDEKKCNKCGSNNISAQVVSENNYKQGHGCLFTILFGLYYWIWLLFKWMFKIVAVSLWYVLALFIIPSKAIYYKVSNSGKTITSADWTPAWVSKLLRRTGKAYTEHKTKWLCGACGNLQN